MNLLESALKALPNVNVEWWHVVAIMLVPAVYFMVRATAVILVARCVKPELAKLALPLLLGSKNKDDF